MPHATRATTRPPKYAFGAEVPPKSERELTEDLDEDLSDAFFTLRDVAATFGDQRIYTSSRSIMFARDVCYMFVRPQKTYLQLTFFLPHVVEAVGVKRGNRVTDKRAANVFRLVHADQVEEPLIDWLRDAYAFAGR